jgi:hypothetical protein
MKQNALLVALVVAVAALTVVVVRQRSEIADLKQATPPVATIKRVVPAEPPARGAMNEEPTPSVEPTPAAPAPAPVAANTNAANNFMSGLAGMMKNPQMKEMVRGQQKAVLDRQYASLLKYYGTRPPADLDALKQLLLDRQMALVDTGLAMMGGSAEDRKQAIEDAKTVKAEYDKRIQDLLGTQDYEVFKQYEATAGERMQVQMFKDALPGDAALTDQQENDLILMMADERKALPASSLLTKGQQADPAQMTEESINEALKQMELLQKRYAERAAAILTPAQLEQFTKWQQQWASMSAAGLKMAQTMFSNKGAQAAPSPTP